MNVGAHGDQAREVGRPDSQRATLLKPLNSLRDRAKGELLVQGDNGYDQARELYSTAVGRRPMAILKCLEVADVVSGVTAAVGAELPISVRGGGHNASGHALCDGGLVLDLTSMNAVQVDPLTKRARSQAGATWGKYDRATQRYGLASTGGVVSSTGLAGLTLNGGVGALRGLTGLACDSLVSVDLVLANGDLVTASAEREPDLFWALQGAGTNFGAVVSLEFDVIEVGPTVAGVLTWPIAKSQEVVAMYRQRADEYPDAFVSEFMFVFAPRGEAAICLAPRYIGTEAESDPWLRAIRRFGCPQDEISEMTYVAAQRFFDAEARWGYRNYWTTIPLTGLGEQPVNIITEFLEQAPSRLSGVVVEHLKGAMTRKDPADSAVNFRHAPYNVFIASVWRNSSDDAANREWARELVRALGPFGAGGAYPNYMHGDAAEQAIEAAYGTQKYRRLQSIKATYDPGNRFRSNQNIRPAALAPAN